MGVGGLQERHKLVARSLSLCLIGGLGFLVAHPGMALGATRTYLGKSIHRLSVTGSNGYRIRVSSYVSRVYHRISLTAEKDDAYARYSVQGVAKNGRIEARFPALGEIAVHFEPQSVKKAPPPPGCQQPREVIERGSFVGKIHFAGELGYTKVDTTSAHGSIVKSKKQTCEVPQNRPSSSSTISRYPSRDFEEIDLRATAGAVHFSASNTNGQPLSTFSVTANEARDGMTIFRSIGEVLAKGDFEYDREHLASAAVTPPAPFLGKASYTGLRDPEAGGMFPGFSTEGTISGTLRTPLPGLGVVSLAGPDVSASLSRGVGRTE